MATHTWNFDNAHSTVGFTIKHMMFTKVRGQFTEWTGSLTYDPADISKAAVNATLTASSINTSNEERDQHLKSEDFFNVEKFPTLTYKSSRWEKVGDKFHVHGDLTMHGVTKPVTLEVTENGQGIDPWGNQRIAFTATTTINRKDFGLNWNSALEAGGVLVGEDVHVEIEVEATRAKE